MPFSFLHAADLHLGSPFTGLTLREEVVAKRFAAASREAFSSLVTNAINAKVAFVVIAGDVYDGEWKDHASIGLFFNREARSGRTGRNSRYTFSKATMMLRASSPKLFTARKRPPFSDGQSKNFSKRKRSQGRASRSWLSGKRAVTE